MFRVASSPLRRTAAVLAGVTASALAAEAVLRLFVTSNGPPPPAISRDAVDLPTVTVREMEEGLGTARFSTAGARLTGNPPLVDGRTSVIIGDSYVVAREVRDDVTMGAWLERAARAEHYPLNVRQYGWRGASPARYVMVAAEVLSRWKPDAVIVVVSEDDFDEHATGVSYPWFRIDSAGSATVVPDPKGEPIPQEPPRSVLATLVIRRREQILARAPLRVRRLLVPQRPNPLPGPAPDVRATASTATRDMVPRAIVRALKGAYGGRLMLIYTAQVRVTGGEQPDLTERRVLDACAEERVSCASTRQSMLAAREHGSVVRGFSTTTLGVGHLNAEGHRLTGAVIWNLMQPRLGIMAAK